jgi:DNA polymerase-3 subunit epsilon
VLSRCPVYLDTETTGLERSDEIVEIAIVDDEGNVLFESLVKPRKRIPAEATMVHHITNAMVENASAWPIVWEKAKGVLQGKLIVMYNDDFDLRMMKQSYLQYNLRWNDKLETYDLLKLYGQFRGEWDYRHNHYRYHSLANAGIDCGISLPNAHRATADTLLTRALLHYIAQAAG